MGVGGGGRREERESGMGRGLRSERRLAEIDKRHSKESSKNHRDS